MASRENRLASVPSRHHTVHPVPVGCELAVLVANSMLLCCALCVQVMDETAVTLCKENDIKIVIFDAMVPGNIMRASMGEDVGTLVSHTC